MSEWIDELSNDIDKLLLEIGFTGALYGAGDLCSPVYTYLRTNEPVSYTHLTLPTKA